MKRRTIKRTLIAVTCAATLLVGSVSMCFGAVVQAQENPASVPALLTVGAPTSIDFSVTEKITMTGTAGSTDLTVDSLEVKNNGTVGVITIDSIAVDPETGWTLADYADTDWAKLPANAKTFGLQTGTHDMFDGEYTAAGDVNPEATVTTNFNGKTGIVTNALSDLKVADIVGTVSYK